MNFELDTGLQRFETAGPHDRGAQQLANVGHAAGPTGGRFVGSQQLLKSLITGRIQIQTFA